jgi:hypothetical protein
VEQVTNDGKWPFPGQCWADIELPLVPCKPHHDGEHNRRSLSPRYSCYAVDLASATAWLSLAALGNDIRALGARR